MGIGVNVVLVVDIDVCAAVDRDDRKTFGLDDGYDMGSSYGSFGGLNDRKLVDLLIGESIE